MGFRVIRDFIKDADEKGAVGIESAKPKNFWQSHMGVDSESESYVYSGGTIKVRVKDDDGNIYYHLYVDDVDFSCELALDWASMYAGTTDLDLRLKDYVEHVGKPRYEKLISKDGKWYHYMG